MLSRCFILSLICNILIAQLSITGSLKPSGMFRISDHSRIDLPFRIAELELGYTMGDFDFMLNSAVEYRWGENNYVFDLLGSIGIWNGKSGSSNGMRFGMWSGMITPSSCQSPQ